MSDQSENEVIYEINQHVATITFNRAEKQNTISGPMLNRLSELMLKADADPEIRAIVITGSGKFFCAGLDLRGSDISKNLATNKKSPVTLDLKNTPPTVLHNLDTPTIAAINGSAAGYGMDLALGCDIRVMADNAKLAAAFTARGVVPESGGTWILPRLIGWAKASEIIFTGKTLLAEECLELGLVSHMVNNNEVREKSLEIARQISSRAPLAVQASKRMMRMGMNENFNDHVHHVFLQLLPLFQSDDFAEGMASFMEKREAEFKGK